MVGGKSAEAWLKQLLHSQDRQSSLLCSAHFLHEHSPEARQERHHHSKKASHLNKANTTPEASSYPRRTRSYEADNYPSCYVWLEFPKQRKTYF